MIRLRKVWWVVLGIAIAVSVFNRPTSFIPIWIRAGFWHITHSPNVELNGTKVSLPIEWWIQYKDANNISFLRAPIWNKATEGMVSLRRTHVIAGTLDSLKRLYRVGNDSVIAVKGLDIKVAGKGIPGVRFEVAKKEGEEIISYEMYPMEDYGLMLDIINVPLDERSYLTSLLGGIAPK